MPPNLIQTFADIEVAWQSAERESDKRAVWRALAKGGWLRACRAAVQRRERTTFETWLDAGDFTRQEIMQFAGAEAAQLVHLHLLCSHVVCGEREGASWEQLKSVPGAGAFPLPRGFCCDLMRALVGEPLRTAARSVSLSVLLVDTARNEGVEATLSLARLADGEKEWYCVPELAFLRDTEARQAEDHARAYVARTGLWQQEWDVRWQVQRRDGKPLVTLSGPSLGAAFALGLAKLCAARS